MPKPTWIREAYPYLMIGGLVLAHIGNGIAHYVPMTPEDVEREEQLEYLQEMTERVPAMRNQARWQELSIRSQRIPPYRLPGQVLIVGGATLILLGLFAWYRVSATNR